MAFDPLYTVTPDIIRSISRIEISRHDMGGLPITTEMMVLSQVFLMNELGVTFGYNYDARA